MHQFFGFCDQHVFGLCLEAHHELTFQLSLSNAGCPPNAQEDRVRARATEKLWVRACVQRLDAFAETSR